MLDACAKTARKMSAQEPCARKGRISFVWLCLHPIYSKNIKNNKTEFNFAQITTLTVCLKRAPRQCARWALKNWARMKAASLLYCLVHVQFTLKTWKRTIKLNLFYTSDHFDCVLEVRAKTARKVSARELSAREGSIFFVWPCLHPIHSKNIKKQ